jgi:hypothetical protein
VPSAVEFARRRYLLIESLSPVEREACEEAVRLTMQIDSLLYERRREIRRRPGYALGHGTRGEYVNHRCRCDECTDANAAYGRELRRKARLRAGIKPRRRADGTPLARAD